MQWYPKRSIAGRLLARDTGQPLVTRANQKLLDTLRTSCISRTSMKFVPKSVAPRM